MTVFGTGEKTRTAKLTTIKKICTLNGIKGYYYKFTRVLHSAYHVMGYMRIRLLPMPFLRGKLNMSPRPILVLEPSQPHICVSPIHLVVDPTHLESCMEPTTKCIEPTQMCDCKKSETNYHEPVNKFPPFTT